MTAFTKRLEKLIPWPRLLLICGPLWTEEEERALDPFPLPTMLRAYVLHACCDAGDEDIAELIADNTAVQGFLGLPRDFDTPLVRDIVRFRDFLTLHGLDKQVTMILNRRMDEAGLTLRRGHIPETARRGFEAPVFEEKQ